MSNNRAVCVLLGANSGKGVAYEEAAQRLGKAIALNGIKLVYGGSSIGLMGILANEAINNGGEVVGVITKQLYDVEPAHLNLTKLYVVDTMQERKLLMAQLSDACIALPGGLGTLEEIFEFWNAVKLGIYKKPFGLLNTNDYYKKMFEFMEHVVENEFVNDEYLRVIKVTDNANDLVASIFSNENHEKNNIKPTFTKMFA